MTYATMKVEVTLIVQVPNGKTLDEKLAREMAHAVTIRTHSQHTIEQTYISVFAKGTREFLFRN